MKRLAVVMAAVVLGGCGDGVHEKARVLVHADFLYFNKADGESGGAYSRTFDLATSGRGAYLRGDVLADVDQADDRWVKVTIREGDHARSSGWVRRSEVRVPDAAELRTHVEQASTDEAAKAKQRKAELAAQHAEAAAVKAKGDAEDMEYRLSRGKHHIAAGELYLASQYFADVVKKYPGTSEARYAADQIAVIEKMEAAKP